MAITKDKKRAISAKLDEAFGEATAAAFVGFNKISVADTSAMRRDLKKAGVRYFVAKKTLLRRALNERGYQGNIPELPGEVALVWSAEEDSTLPSRSVYGFIAKFKGGLSLLGGVFEGAYADREKITAIATIPPVPVLRGMFLNVINSPIQGVVIALDKIREAKSA